MKKVLDLICPWTKTIMTYYVCDFCGREVSMPIFEQVILHDQTREACSACLERLQEIGNKTKWRVPKSA